MIAFDFARIASLATGFCSQVRMLKCTSYSSQVPGFQMTSVYSSAAVNFSGELMGHPLQMILFHGSVASELQSFFLRNWPLCLLHGYYYFFHSNLLDALVPSIEIKER